MKIALLVRISEEIITKFLCLLEYFKKDIEIIKLPTHNDFIRGMNESKKDIGQGNISSFKFDDFERKIG